MSKVGWITIIGRPNVGKSTLMNTVLQTPISLVTPKAQTTRDRILGIFTEKEGQILFTDTPGIHRAKKEGGLNFYMLNEAKIALDSPQLIWYLVDPHSEFKHEERVLDFLKEQKKIQENAVPIFLIINKMDQLGPGTNRKKSKSRLNIAPTETEVRLAPVNHQKIETFEKALIQGLQERGLQFQRAFRISAALNTGVDELLAQSWNVMPEGDPFYGDSEQVSDRPIRFFVSEIIRGRLFCLLGEEVPYSCAVHIENYDEKSKPLRIEATIYVERDSQKGIVIGQGGKKIKEIGQSARQEIEKLVDQQIFLGLKVKLLKNWSENPAEMRQLGYSFGSSK